MYSSYMITEVVQRKLVSSHKITTLRLWLGESIGRAGSWTNLAHAHSLAYSNQLRCQWGLLGNFCAPPYSSELPSI